MKTNISMIFKFPTYWKKYKFIEYKLDEWSDLITSIQVALFKWFAASMNLDNYHSLTGASRSESQPIKNIQPKDLSWHNFILNRPITHSPLLQSQKV